MGSYSVYVKREDLCCPYPGPSFSKIRGVVAHIRLRPEPVIGVLDTFHSKAGWAVSYVCRTMGKTAVNYYPVYKGHPPGLRPTQIEADRLGAQLVPMSAGRSAVLFHAARKALLRSHPKAYMMPNALKLSESVTENATETAASIVFLPAAGTIVISISSGTVAAGILRGLADAGALSRYDVVLHMGYSRSIEACRRYIHVSAGLWMDEGSGIRFVDEGYDYAEAATGISAPFPCNPFYDLKAWKWMCENISTLTQPLTFWNIGD